MKTQVARTGKNFAVFSLIALSVFSMMVTSMHQAYAQQQGEEQVASDGGLTVTLNGDTFRKGDEIVVRGTVEERDIGSNAVIEVIDPESQRVESGYPSITADNTFIYRFVAGEEEPFSISDPMEVTGNYRMEVRYTTPDRDREAVEFVFAYIGDEEIVEDVDEEEAVEPTTTAVVNVTAINQTAAQAIEVLQTLDETLTGENGDDIGLSAEHIRLYLNTTQNLLMNIRGNVTSAFSVPPEEEQVIVTNGDEAQLQQPLSPQESQTQQQVQQQNGEVSIVPGASNLTDEAFQPNPIQVSVGDTVTWTNDDSQPHTVTSGANIQPDGIFDAGIMVPQQTFEHTFTEAGEYTYFCILHHYMVGTVSVS